MRILSLGMGVQSTALYYMSSMGILPRCDYAIFSDPGREKTKTMWYIQYLLEWQKKNNGIEIRIVDDKNLYEDLLNSKNSTDNRFSSIPAFVKGEEGDLGMLRRQCTNEYKIEQVDREIRKIYGLAPKKMMPITEIWKGITVDEIDRMNVPDSKRKIFVYPFCGYSFTIDKQKKTVYKRVEGKRMSRTDVVSWYNSMDLPIPPKSSCVFCPYQSDAAWADLKKNAPEDFFAAVQVDNAIRDSTKKGIEHKAYLHRSLRPLEDISFDNDPTDIWNGNCSSDCDI